MPPKPLVFRYGDQDVPMQMAKIDRSKLYGYKEMQVVDDKERACELATLSGDGQTVIGRGGTAIAYLSTDGLWCDRGELTPVDVEGQQITPVPSSFSESPELVEKVSIDEYIEHDIRILYQMSAEEGAEELIEELRGGTIYRFPFSYRGGLEADAGFLLMGDDGNLFMTIGTRVNLEFVGLQQAAAVVEEDDEPDDQDAMDFDMI